MEGRISLPILRLNLLCDPAILPLGIYPCGKLFANTVGMPAGTHVSSVTLGLSVHPKMNKWGRRLTSTCALGLAFCWCPWNSESAMRACKRVLVSLLEDERPLEPPWLPVCQPLYMWVSVSWSIQLQLSCQLTSVTWVGAAERRTGLSPAKSADLQDIELNDVA